MKQNQIFDTLLKQLTLDDYQSLIEQEKLRQEGYTLHFVIDAGLISNFCYPKGIIEAETSNERRIRLTDDYIADEQVTLHSIFSLNKKHDRVILADEHYPEFKAMLLKASRQKVEKINLGLDYVNIKTLKIGQFRDFIYDNFSKAIADVLLQINGLKKAANLFKEKLIIFEAKDFENPLLTNAANLCRATERQDYILDIWRRFVKSDLRHSKSRDAGVIDRILSINEYIQNNGDEEGRKHVFIYLTDSPDTKLLFQGILKNPNLIKYPKINGKKISLIRNVPQAFAYLISLRYNTPEEIDPDGTIQNLSELSKTSEQVMYIIEDTEKTVGINKDGKLVEVDIFSNKIFANYNQLRNVFENTGLLKSFQGLYKSIKNEIADLDHSLIQELYDRLTNELGIMQGLTSAHAEYLVKLYDEALFSTAFIKGLSLLKNSSAPLNLSKGCDPVEGSYHHLPIFLAFPLESQGYRENMNHLMFLILDRKNDKEQFSVQLNSLIEKMEVHSYLVDEQIEMKILKAFILMIMPSLDGQFGGNSDSHVIVNDVLADRWLKVIYESPEKNNLQPSLHADLLYQLCWISRRIGEYLVSLQYAEEGKLLFPSDPRFYHGFFLASYSQFEEKKSIGSKKAIKDLYLILNELNIAKKLYRPFLLENFKGFNSELMELRLQETFYNSSCYILTLIAKEHHESNDFENIMPVLYSAREQLTNLKQLGSYVEWMPEYCDTEAFLEYLESYYLEDKIFKIQNAKSAIERAISQSRSLTLTIKYQKKCDAIEKRFNELKNEAYH